MQGGDFDAMAIGDIAEVTSAPEYFSKQGELDLFLIAIMIRRRVRFIGACAVIGFFLMSLVMLISTPRFSASAVLLVPQSSPSAASMALKLATGGADLGGGSSEVYEDILESHTVADRLIGQYHLKDIYKTKDILSTEKLLASRTKVTTSKEGMIKVTVQDVDATRAANLANSYLTELDRTNEQLAITSAGQQRLYFEREMIKEKNSLADAEVAMEKTQEDTGILAPAGQLTAKFQAIEQTRADLRLRQVQLGALAQGATEENPDVIRLKAEIQGLEKQLKEMESGPEDSAAVGIPTSKAPEKTLEYIRKARDVKFHEAVFELLAKQWQIAKQEEAKTVSQIQVLDPAVVPEHKTWPPRTLFCLLGFAGGALIGIIWALVESFFHKMMSNPENQKKYKALVGATTEITSRNPPQ